MKKRTINILRAKKRENIKVQRRCFKERKKGEFLKKMGQRTKKNRTDKSGFFFSCLFCCQYIKLLSFLQC